MAADFGDPSAALREYTSAFRGDDERVIGLPCCLPESHPLFADVHLVPSESGNKNGKGVVFPFSRLFENGERLHVRQLLKILQDRRQHRPPLGAERTQGRSSCQATAAGKFIDEDIHSRKRRGLSAACTSYLPCSGSEVTGGMSRGLPINGVLFALPDTHGLGALAAAPVVGCIIVAAGAAVAGVKGGNSSRSIGTGGNIWAGGSAPGTV